MSKSDIYETTFDEDVPRESTNQCPECDGRVTTNAVETVCEDCGLVIKENQIDRGPEWRSFEDDDHTRARTGAPLTATRHDRGLATTIGYGTDGNGNALSGRKRGRFARLRREQSRGRFQSTADRILAHGLGEVRRITSALGLSKQIREQACTLFRRAQNEDLLKGRSVEAIATASVHGTARCNGLSRTLGEVVAVSRVDQSSVRNAYKVLNTELGLPTKPVTPSDFVPRFASALDVSDEIQRRALLFADTAESAEITVGVQPSGFAAACLYKASNERGLLLTQSRVAEVADTSPVTIRAHCESLEEVDG
ncbi:transcription initiation factor IIB [Halorussus halophilus]|uniref:transcription initiation factor IIB n=1 Tax=Halorussus halophilus TaxID=2650975 RepID=UPI0013016594|nr:transcription initiation factor IIB family protein [Halorussus halophilus]